MRTSLLGLLAIAPAFAQTPPSALFDAPILPILMPGVAEEMELLGDLDGDSDVDAIGFVPIGSGGGPKFSFRPMLNDGSGTFTQGTSVALPSEAGHRVHIADVDGDGTLDLLVSTTIASASGAGVLVYRGLGGGSFAAPIHVPLAGNLLALGSGNANGDGIADVFVLHFAPGSTGYARWLLGGPGLGLPIAQTAAFTNQTMVSGEVLDVDSDGVSDFAVTIFTGVGMDALLFRTTPGGFVPWDTEPIAVYTNLMLAADADGPRDAARTEAQRRPRRLHGGAWILAAVARRQPLPP
ncbi:MAG TPA: VCBS repeat-containing protein [Planctomycetota bacterium]